MLQKGSLFWRQVASVDENTFTLDGRDGLASYWLDLHRQQKLFTRHKGRASLMLCGSISVHVASNLVSVHGKINWTQ